jgi:hypothetical protein
VNKEANGWVDDKAAIKIWKDWQVHVLLSNLTGLKFIFPFFSCCAAFA